MNYRDWLISVPHQITDDSLWKMEAYRLALFLSDVAWQDATKLSSDSRTRSLADQLYRAVGSVSANFAEGYSRSGGRDRARFYEYALGSAREARGWYFKGRHVLGAEAAMHRLQVLTEIIRLALVMVPHNRDLTLREDETEYASGMELGLDDDRLALQEEVPF